MSSDLCDPPLHDRPNVHSCGRYASMDDMILQAATFFRAGFARGERCVLITGGGRDRAAALLSDRLGRGTGVEVIGLSEVYALAAHRTTGVVDALAMTDVWQSMIDESLESGTTGLRVTADVECLVRDDGPRRAFLDYERSIGRFIASHPMSALCLYPDDAPTADEFAEFACVHDVAPASSSTFRLFFSEPGVLRICGELDALDRTRFTAALERIGLDGDEHLAFELSELDFIDHGAIVALEDWARRHERHVEVRGQRPLVERLIDLVGAERLVVGTRQERRDV